MSQILTRRPSVDGEIAMSLLLYGRRWRGRVEMDQRRREAAAERCRRQHICIAATTDQKTLRVRGVTLMRIDIDNRKTGRAGWFRRYALAVWRSPAPVLLPCRIPTWRRPWPSRLWRFLTGRC